MSEETNKPNKFIEITEKLFEKRKKLVDDYHLAVKQLSCTPTYAPSLRGIYQNQMDNINEELKLLCEILSVTRSETKYSKDGNIPGGERISDGKELPYFSDIDDQHDSESNS